MKINLHTESLCLRQPFRIAGRKQRAVEALVVELEGGRCVGHSEGQDVFYLDEAADTMFAQVEAVAAEISQGLSHEAMAGAPRPWRSRAVREG